MSGVKWMGGILAVSLILFSSPSFAQEKEHGGKEHGGATTTAPSGTEQPAAPTGGPTAAVTAPVAPEEAPVAPAAPVTPPALKPITITFSGEISAVNSTDAPPMVAVQDRYGVKKEISVPAETKITSGTASKALADLKAGDKVTVEYTYDVATGKRTAQSITLGEATPAGK